MEKMVRNPKAGRIKKECGDQREEARRTLEQTFCQHRAGDAHGRSTTHQQLPGRQESGEGSWWQSVSERVAESLYSSQDETLLLPL